MTQKLTRKGARNVTRVFDRMASLVQEELTILGIDPKIALDYAKRTDIVSDLIERTAVANFPAKEAATDEEGLSVEPTGGYDPNAIADKVPGPLEKDPDESYMATFDETEHHELAERQEAGDLPSADKFAADSHGFNLFEE